MDDPQVGTVLDGRFRIDEKLGGGGYGYVYAATQLDIGRKVALKLLKPGLTRDYQVRERFRREGLVLCNLRNEHTITTYDFAQTEDGTMYIVMELLHGKSLKEVVQHETPADWRRMLKLLIQICKALSEAHSSGIVHRDLKPANIHIEERPGNPEFVKVLDFGIAKIVEGEELGMNTLPQLTARGQIVGTVRYMSPEQLMGSALDGRSDIYTLGVVVYRLVTGQLPFPNVLKPAELIAAQLRNTPQAPSQVATGIPKSIDRLVLRMLAKDVAQRFADVDELRVACEELLATEVGDENADAPRLSSADTRSSRPTPDRDAPDDATTMFRSRSSAGTRVWVAVGVAAALLAVAVTLGLLLS